MESTKNISVVQSLVRQARRSMAEFQSASQERVDEAVIAIAWALYEDTNAAELAELAILDTRLGNVTDKFQNNKRKTFGTLRDLLRVKTVGIIEEDEEKGLIKYAKPVGVVAAVTPSTNPAATPINKCMMAVKGRNAVIVAPSPAGWVTTNAAIQKVREQFSIIGVPENLVQILPAPVNRPTTEELMKSCDLVVVTGSQNNVKGAYSSGTPAIGVGVGNVPVVVDETADLDQAARLICASKTFDNGTSCSSENSAIVLEDVYSAMRESFQRHGGYIASAEEANRIRRLLWTAPGELNRKLIAKDVGLLIDQFGLNATLEGTKFIIVEETGIGPEYPLSGEKLSLILTLYRASNIVDAREKVKKILSYQGAGHSCGIHTNDLGRAKDFAENLDVVRVLVNQAHTFGNGGGFTSGLNFTLSMGCGTWGGNSISENLSYRHFINITHLSTEIPEDKPSEESLFGDFLREYHPEYRF